MSNTDLLKSKIDNFINAKERNKHLNCITHDLSTTALENIKLLDEEAPLFGKTFAIKDNIHIKGSPTTCASEILNNHNSIYNATVIDRIQESGGSILAKTNLDEFAMGSSNEHSIYGPCRNPMNDEYVCGGSSGGSAAAVSADIVDIALGSDTGGSVRQPAAFCGVIGFKPTYGRISRFGLTAFASSFDQIGIFSKSIENVISTFESISGYDENDTTTSKINVENFIYSSDNAAKLTIGIPKQYIPDSIDPEIEDSLLSMKSFLKKHNFNIKEIDLPFTDKSIPTYYILTTAEAASNLSRYDGVRYGLREKGSNVSEMYKRTRTNGFGEEVKRRIILGTFVLSSGYYDDYYNKALKIRRLIKNDFNRAFQDVDLILTPTSPFPPFKIGEKKEPIEMYLSDIYTVPMSLAGLPAINIPSGSTKLGLPIGLQLTANQFKENNIFNLTNFIMKNYS